MDDAITSTGVFAVNNTTPPTPSDARAPVLPLFSLKGKTAIITGAGAGIGLAVAHAYAEAGANVAIWYNSNKEAITRAEEIEKQYGVTCRAYQVDVTSEPAIRKAVYDLLPTFSSRLDIFVANSGIPWTQGAILTAPSPIPHYQKVVSTDLDSIFYCALVAGEVFRQQHASKKTLAGDDLTNYTGGSFIATASMSGHIVNTPQMQSAYNAVKAGVIHLCRCLAVEWVKFARVNTVSPGYMKTEITDFVPQETREIWQSKIPMGREGEVGELKGAFLYFASDAASYTTGADLIVDGGYCVP